jgi:hypothetical protein
VYYPDPSLSIYVEGPVLAIVFVLWGSLRRFDGGIRTLRVDCICKVVLVWMKGFGGVLRFEHLVLT